MREDFTKINNTTYNLEKIFPDAKDFLPLLGTDYVEFYVGNAKQAAHFYKTALRFQTLNGFGFSIVFDAGFNFITGMHYGRMIPISKIFTYFR